MSVKRFAVHESRANGIKLLHCLVIYSGGDAVSFADLTEAADWADGLFPNQLSRENLLVRSFIVLQFDSMSRPVADFHAFQIHD